MRTYSTPTVAKALDLVHMTLYRWVVRWYPNVGSGNRIRLTDVDVMVAVAWKAWHLTCQTTGSYRDTADVIRAAIIDDPRRWLIVSDGTAQTVDTAEQAARLWLACGTSHALLIDLQPALDLDLPIQPAA